MRRPLPRILLAAVWCLLLVRGARAGDAAARSSLVPSGVDLFIAVDDAAALRRGPGGEVYRHAVTFLSKQGDLPRAWLALAQTLGLEGDRAFDDLLGRGAVFVQRDPKAGPAPPAWALIADVSPDTERLIRERLKPAPRIVQQGVRVLALEDGRFWLASTTAKKSATILLAAAAAPELFDEILPMLGVPRGDSLAASKYGADLRTIHPGADALLFARRRDEKGRLTLFGLGAQRALGGCTLGLLVRSEALADSLAAIEATPPASFDALRADALLVESGWRVPGFYDALGIPATDAFLPALFRNFDGKAWLSPRTAFALWPGADRSLRGGLAFASSDLDSLAPAADRFIAAMFTRADDTDASAPEESLLDLKGQFLDTPREVNPADPLLSAGGFLWPARTPFAWAFVRTVAEPPSLDGWWVIGTGASSVERLGEALPGDLNAPRNPAPTLSVGLIRPARLGEALESAGGPLAALLPEMRDILRRIDMVEWSFTRGDGGSLRGVATVTFAPAAPAR